MLELPEALTISRQLNQTVMGKTVARVLPPVKPHKFCWFAGDAADYDAKLRGMTVMGAAGFGMFCELTFSGGVGLCIDDGVNVRFVKSSDIPKSYQLAVIFTDATALVFTVAMYGGIVIHEEEYANEYYIKSRNAVSLLSDEFYERYSKALAVAKPTMSVKAFLATEQRFPGLGNGVLQDILFAAKLNPKRRLSTLSDEETEKLCCCVQRTVREMTELGGRDTEKDIFGNCGGYVTKMSKNALERGCPVCGSVIVKEAYMGGSVYYCPTCQRLK